MKYKYLIFFLLTSFFTILPIKAMTPSVEYINNVYSNRIGTDKTYSGQLGYITGDGKYLYCLDPYHIIGQDYVLDNSYLNNISPETLKYIEMVANYSERYLINKNSNYYMAAQEIIWDKMVGEGKIFWSTGKDDSGSRINISDYKSQLKSRVDLFFTKPSFDGTTVKDNFYTLVELTDTNNVLSNYQVINSSKNQVWIDGNKLYIKILSSELTEVKLVRKYGSGSPTYYHSDINQDLAQLNGYVENVATIKIQASNKYNEDINIQFMDSDDNSLVTDKIDFKIVSNNSENDFSTSNGMYLLNLEEDEYTIITENVPYGYILPGAFNIKISESNFYQKQTICIFLYKPQGQLNVISEKEGLYQLYKEENFDFLLSTFENSKYFNLEFGKYYVLDLTNHKKYSFELKYKDQYTPFVRYDLYIVDDAKVDNDDKTKDSDTKNTTLKESVNSYSQPSKNDDVIKEDVGDGSKETNNYSLPNTINYIEIAKALIVILLIIFIINDVKDNKK